MHVTVHLDALTLIVKLLSNISSWNLLVVNAMYATCEWCNFVSVDAMMMILICTCSALHDLNFGLICIHVRVHLDTLIPVAKVHIAVNC